MRIVVIAAFLAVVLGLLFGPSFWLARRLQERGDWAAVRGLRVVWPLQLIAAAGLFLLADWMDLRNPAGVTVAIIAAVSLGGAAMLWLWRTSLRALRHLLGRGA